MRSPVPSLCAALLALPCGFGGHGVAPFGPNAPAQEVVAELQALRTQLVAQLETLALWCQEKKLYLDRDRLYTAILSVETDHAKARRALRYRRTGDGPWTRRNYHEPKNRGLARDTAELAERRASLSAASAPHIIDTLDRLGLEGERRELELRRFLLLNPDDVELHGGLGLVRVEGEWREASVVRALTTREQHAQLVVAARDAVPALKTWFLEPPFDGIELAWTTSVHTERAKVTGTVSAAEIQRVAQTVHLLHDLLRELAPPPVRPGRGTYSSKRRADQLAARRASGPFNVFLLSTKAQIPALLAAWPKITGERAKLSPQLASQMLDGQNSLGVWGGTAAGRLDTTSRQVIGAYLREHFGLTEKQGWAWEGFGIYLTHVVIGTRLNFFVRPGNYVNNERANLDRKLLDNDVDWIAALNDVMHGSRPPRINYVIGKDVNHLTPPDLVFAHALAAYLLENFPERLQNILRRVGQPEAAAGVLEAELGRGLLDIQADLLRWAAGMSQE